MRFTIADLRLTRSLPFRKPAPVRSAVAALAGSFLLTSCHQRDVQLTHDVVGLWANGDADQIHIYADGNFRAKSAQTNAGIANVWNYAGLWEIRDGVLVAIITNSFALNSTNFEPSGSTNEYRIIRADTNSLVWEFNGQTISYQRR